MGLNTKKGNNLGESPKYLKQIVPLSPLLSQCLYYQRYSDVLEREGFYDGTFLFLPQDDETCPVNVSSSVAVSPKSQKCT